MLEKIFLPISLFNVVYISKYCSLYNNNARLACILLNISPSENEDYNHYYFYYYYYYYY